MKHRAAEHLKLLKKKSGNKCVIQNRHTETAVPSCQKKQAQIFKK
jgi:predicted nucleic acid-binding Zn ribbon protein